MATTFVAIGQNHWGKGGTADEATAAWEAEGGDQDGGYTLLEFGEGLTFEGCNYLGQVAWLGKGEPIVTEVPAK